MGKDTRIEWCDSTLNLEIGCDGCELWNSKVRTCYAGNLVEANKGAKGYPASFDKPELFLDRLAAALKWPDLTGKDRQEKPWLNGLPRLIFLNDLGDTFTESLPVDWLAPCLSQMADSPHQWLILTKRVRRMREFSERHPFPPNVWALCSVDTQGTADARIAELLKVKARVRGVSLEPILGSVDLSFFGTLPAVETPGEYVQVYQRLQWVIVGGESGPGARPCHQQHIRSVIRQCSEAKTACFVKQMGSNVVDSQGCRVKFNDAKGGDMMEWPTWACVRQMPIACKATKTQGELFSC